MKSEDMVEIRQIGYDALPDLLPDLKRHWKEATSRIRHDWSIPKLVLEALVGDVGTSGTQTLLKIITGIGLIQQAIVITDDILDEDKAGYHLKYPSVGEAVNASMVFTVAGVRLIQNTFLLDLHADRAAYVAGELCHFLLLKTASGQQLEKSHSVHQWAEENYVDVALEKSVPFYQASMQLGALLAGRDLTVDCQQLAEKVGLMIQIVDDTVDAFAQQLSQDWHKAKSNNWLVRTAMEKSDDFSRLVNNIDESTLEEAQQMLIDLGLLEQASKWVERLAAEAHEVINGMELQNNEPLERLVNRYPNAYQFMETS